MDFDTFTMKEIDTIEKFSGVAFSALGEGNIPSRMLAAMAFVAKSREDKSFSLDDAMNLTYKQVVEILGLDSEDDEEDPKEA